MVKLSNYVGAALRITSAGNEWITVMNLHFDCGVKKLFNISKAEKKLHKINKK